MTRSHVVSLAEGLGLVIAGMAIGAVSMRRPPAKELVSVERETSHADAHTGATIRIATEARTVHAWHETTRTVYLPGGRVEVERTADATERTAAGEVEQEHEQRDERTDATRDVRVVVTHEPRWAFGALATTGVDLRWSYGATAAMRVAGPLWLMGGATTRYPVSAPTVFVGAEVRW